LSQAQKRNLQDILYDSEDEYRVMDGDSLGW